MTMQYIDVNGRIGTRMLVGASGKTYGNIELLTDAEKTEAILDGILIYIPPTPPTPDPADVKRQATAQINRKADADIYAIIPESMIARAQARRTELLILEMRNAITEAEIAEAAAIDAKWLQMKAIRVKQQQDIEAL